MRITAIVLFVGVALSARGVAAPVPKHLMKEAESEKTKLQGKWKVESLKMGGQKIAGLGTNFEMTLEFRGDAFTAISNFGAGQKTTATVKHDATAGVKRFTTVNTSTAPLDGKVAAKTEKDELFSYAFDGDKLLLAAPTNDKKEAVDPRKPGPNDVVFVLVRAK